MATRENLIDLEVSLRAEGADKAADEVSAALKEIASAQTRLANVEAQANEARARNNLQLATTLDQAITQQREAIQELINQAAQAASAQAGSGPDPQQANAQATALGAVSDAFAQLKDKLGPIGSLVDGFANALSNVKSPQEAAIALSTAFVGALVGVTAALVNAGQKTGDYIKAQQDLKKTVGGASDNFLAALTIGIERAGGNTSDLADALLQLGDRAKEAAKAGSESAESFTQLGVNVVDATGKLRSIEAIFTDIDRAVRSSTVSQEQLIGLTSILGEESSRQLLPLLGTFEELQNKVSEFGRTFDEDAIKATQSYKTNAADLKNVLEGVGLQIGAGVLPAFESLTKAVVVAVDVLKQDASFTKGLDALLDLVVNFVSTVGPALIQIVTSFSRIAVAGFNLVNETAKNLIDGLVSGFKSVQQFLQPVLETLGLTSQGFRDFDKSLGDALKPEVLKERFGLLGDLFSFLFQSQKQFLDALRGKGEAEKAANDFGKISEKLKDLGKQLEETERQYPKLAVAAKISADEQKAALQAAFSDSRISKEQLDEAILKAERELANNLLKIEQDRLKKLTSLRQQGLLNQTADKIEKAEEEVNKARVERDKTVAEQQAKAKEKVLEQSFKKQILELEEFVASSENEERKLTDSIDQQLQKREISNAEAAKKKLDVEKDTFNKQINFIENLLEIEGLTADQKEEIEKRLQDKKNALRKKESEESRVKREGEVKEIEEQIKRLGSKQQENETLKNVAIQQTTERLKAQGATEAAIVQAVGDLRVKFLDRSIEIKEQEIELLRKEGKDLEKISQIEAEIVAKRAERAKIKSSVNDSLRELKALSSAETVAAQAAQQEMATLRNGVEVLNRSLAVTGGLLAGIIQDFGKGREARFQVVDENNLEAAIKDFQLLQQQIEAVKREALEKGSLLEGGFLNAAIELGNETLEALRKKIGSAQIEIARKVAEESARQRLEVAEETVKKLVEAEKELEEQLEDLRKQKKAANKRAADERSEAEKEANEDIERAEKELEERREENRESFLKRQLDLSKKFREEDLRNAAETAEAVEDARLSASERGLKAAQAAERELTKLTQTENGKRAELQNLLNDPKASKDQIDKARKDLEEATRQREAVEKEQADKRAKEAKRQEAVEGAIKEGGSKEEIDARIEAINAQFEAEQQFQDDLSEAVKSGNQERIENTKKLFEEEQALIRQKLQIELDRLAKEKEAREKERQAERDRLKADFDQKNLELQAQFEKEKVQRQQALDQQLADIKSALDKELMEVKKQKDKLLQEQQRYFNQLAQELGLSSGAFEQYYKAIIEGALNTQKAINDIASELSKLPNSSNSANNSTTSNTSSSNSSFFGGAGRVSVSSLSQQPKADDEDASPTSPKKNFEKEKIRGKAKKSKDRKDRDVDLAEDGLGEEESIETNRSEIAVNVPVSLPKIEIKIQSNSNNIDPAQLEKRLAELVTKETGVFSNALKEKIRQSIVRIGEFQNRQAGIF